MKICPKCKKVFDDRYSFCGSCGLNLEVKQEPVEQLELKKEEPAEKTSGGKEKKNSKMGWIIVGIILALIAIGASLFVIMQPKELTINNGKALKIQVGETGTIKSINGDGVENSDFDNVVWTVDDNNIVKVEGKKVRVHYHSSSFQNHGTKCYAETVIHAELKKGLRTWEGEIPVKVSLKPKEFTSGQILKAPHYTRDTYINFTPSSDYSNYIYMKSRYYSDDDIAFLLKKGEKTTVYVPADTYEVYVATGKTWYSKKYMFGPDTSYTKFDEDLICSTSNYWDIEMSTPDGNLTSTSVNPDDFPE